MSNNPRRFFRTVALGGVLSVLVLFPPRVREVCVIGLAFVVNPLARTVRLLGYFLQQCLNSAGIAAAYYLGVGLSALCARLAASDFLFLRDRGRSTFWHSKDPLQNDPRELERQF